MTLLEQPIRLPFTGNRDTSPAACFSGRQSEGSNYRDAKRSNASGRYSRLGTVHEQGQSWWCWCSAQVKPARTWVGLERWRQPCHRPVNLGVGKRQASQPHAIATVDASAVREAKELWMVEVPEAEELMEPCELSEVKEEGYNNWDGEATTSAPEPKQRRRRIKRGPAAGLAAPVELLAETRRREELDKRLPESGLGLGGTDWSTRGGALRWLEDSRSKRPVFQRRKGQDRKIRQSGGLVNRIVELAKKKQLGQVFHEVEEAAREGTPEVNVVVMNSVLNACVTCGALDRALAVYREMCSPGGVGVTEVTYGILLKGLGNAGCLDEAFALLESMEARTAPGRPKVTDVHLHTLLNACAEAGDAMRARGVMLRGLPPSTFAYNMLLKAYARSDHPLEALKVVDEMRARGVALQRASYNSLISACVKGGRADKALDLLDEMKSRSRLLRTPHLLPDVVTYTTILAGIAELAQAFISQHQDEQKHKYFSASEEDPYPTTSAALSDPVVEAVLSSSAWLGLGGGSWIDEGGPKTGQEWAKELAARKVRAVLTEMKSAPGCVMDRIGYAAAIDACLVIGAMKDVEELFREMEQLGQQDKNLKPRSHTVLALMRAYAQTGNHSQCRHLSEVLVTSRVGGRPSPEERQEAEELLVQALVKGGRFSEARRELGGLRALREGRPLGSAAVQAMVRLYSEPEEYSLSTFEPLLFKPEVSPRSAIADVMTPLAAVEPVAATRSVRQVALRFFHHPVLLVQAGDGRIVGAVFAEDCKQLDVRLADVMRPLPTPVPADATVAQAASHLLHHQSEVVLVVEQDMRRRPRRREREGPLLLNPVVNDEELLSRKLLGVVTRELIFDFNGRNRRLGKGLVHRRVVRA